MNVGFSHLPAYLILSSVMKRRDKGTGMVQGMFPCCLGKTSLVFLEYLNFFYKPSQEQNTVKPFVVQIQIVVRERLDDISLG